jgi:hypothetical protein
MMTAYGYQIESENDHIIKAATEAVEILSNSVFPGAVAVNTFPVCMSKFSTFLHCHADPYQ